MVLVTNQEYYMNAILKSNLDEVPRFLKKAWDCVIVVSGHGKVRIGKSTMAIQIGYYLAWLISKIKKEKKVRFDNSNIVFDPENLMKIASKLPPNSVIIYDEGRFGLDSARAMESINKIMMDFFQECGQYQHVIIIVLPNFFRLREDIAVPRSLFLVDVYTDRNYNRGYFKFYNEVQKEFLFVIGKRKLGIFNKYNSVHSSFSGRFTKYCTIDEELYAKQKRIALKKKKLTKFDIRLNKRVNDGMLKLKNGGWSEEKIGALFDLTQPAVNSRIEKAKKEEKKLNPEFAQ